jgi:hypothetical protein
LAGAHSLTPEEASVGRDLLSYYKAAEEKGLFCFPQKSASLLQRALAGAGHPGDLSREALEQRLGSDFINISTQPHARRLAAAHR